ncbi:MAG TPA: (2Fe-2S)-binding protein, partial [Phenylobacterium sp.]|nr:(2Fe-2S)-binding protein [Phenylobacterium sp.]
VTSSGALPPRAWLAELFEAPALPPEARATLLFGRPPGPMIDKGPMVCACLKVAARTIDDAARAGAVSVEAVGAVTGAGTNCGSCRPEIARRLAALDLPLEARNAA